MLTETITDIVQSDIPVEWSACYIAVSAVDRRITKSSLSNVVQLVKTSKGWVIPK